MFLTPKRIVHLHVNGRVIRTVADHPFYVEGKGWINAADMPGAKVEGEDTVHQVGDPAMPHFPVMGFTGDTPILTPDGYKAIKDIKPGDMILVKPDDQGDDEQDADNAPRWWEGN